MSELSVDVKHRLGQSEALARVQARIVALLSQHGEHVSDPQVVWNGARGDFRLGVKMVGADIAGTISVNENNVVLNGSVPPTLIFFRGIVEDAVRKDLEKCLC